MHVEHAVQLWQTVEHGIASCKLTEVVLNRWPCLQSHSSCVGLANILEPLQLTCKKRCHAQLPPKV